MSDNNNKLAEVFAGLAALTAISKMSVFKSMPTTIEMNIEIQDAIAGLSLVSSVEYAREYSKQLYKEAVTKPISTHTYVVSGLRKRIREIKENGM